MIKVQKMKPWGNKMNDPIENRDVVLRSPLDTSIKKGSFDTRKF